jgi:hypothetical protein
VEANAALLGRLRRRLHELADGFEHNLELPVMLTELAVYVLQLAGQVLVSRENLSQPNKGPHNGDVDFDSPVTVEDTESMATPCSVKA